MSAPSETSHQPNAPAAVVVVRRCPRLERDISLCYDTFGDPSHHPLVLIMGLNGQMIVWDEEFCARLAREARLFVIRFDNRDVGHSSKVEDLPTPSIFAHALPGWLQWTKTPEPYTLDCMAHDVWALVDKVVSPTARVSLMGVSMGGMIAQCATLQKPERVASLVSIMSTTGAHDLPGPALWVKWELSKKPKSRSLEDRVAFRLAMIENMLSYGVPFTRDQHHATTRRVVERTDYMEGFARQLAAISRTPPRDHLFRALEPHRTPPTLVLHGAADVLVPHACGQRTAEVIHGAELVTFDDMGHCLDRLHYDRVIEHVRRITEKGLSRAEAMLKSQAE